MDADQINVNAGGVVRGDGTLHVSSATGTLASTGLLEAATSAIDVPGYTVEAVDVEAVELSPEEQARRRAQAAQTKAARHRSRKAQEAEIAKP